MPVHVQQDHEVPQNTSGGYSEEEASQDSEEEVAWPAVREALVPEVLGLMANAEQGELSDGLFSMESMEGLPFLGYFEGQRRVLLSLDLADHPSEEVAVAALDVLEELNAFAARLCQRITYGS